MNVHAASTHSDFSRFLYNQAKLPAFLVKRMYFLLSRYFIYRSLSFICATAAMAFLLLTFCYIAIDVKHWWDGAPFHFAGIKQFFFTLSTIFKWEDRKPLILNLIIWAPLSWPFHTHNIDLKYYTFNWKWICFCFHPY